MTLPQAAFIILSAVILVSAVLVVTRRNVIHSAIWLIVTLLSVGGIYLILQAEFLLAVQIILYVGGIMVLFLFVLMLVSVEATVRQAAFNRQWPLALGAGTLLLAELAYAVWSGRGRFSPALRSTATLGAGNTQAVGTILYRNYMLPVELASLLLLVAMVGAVLMAKKRLP